MSKFFITAFTALALVVGTSTSQASIEIRVDNVVVGNPTGSNSAAYSGTAASGVFVEVSGSSNSPGGPGAFPAADTKSVTANSTTRVFNTSDFTQTVTIRVSEVDFAFPTLNTPYVVEMDNSLNHTDNPSGSNLDSTTQGYLDFTNSRTTAGADTTGAVVLNNITPSGGLIPTTFLFGNVDAVPFSMILDVTLTLGAGDEWEYSSSLTAKAVPEPASIAVWSLMGLVGAVIAVRVRKQK